MSRPGYQNLHKDVVVSISRAASWGGNPPARGAARDRLLEASAECIARDGVAATGIASIAKEAGVSRPTVYRYFEDRDALIQATLFWAVASLRDRAAAHVAGFHDPGQQIVEGAAFSVEAMRQDPLLRIVWGAEQLDAMLLRQTTSPASIAFARPGLEPAAETLGWNDEEADEAAEIMLRFMHSLLWAPDPQRDAAETRAFLERRLLPALGL